MAITSNVAYRPLVDIYVAHVQAIEISRMYIYFPKSTVGGQLWRTNICAITMRTKKNPPKVQSKCIYIYFKNKNKIKVGSKHPNVDFH